MDIFMDCEPIDFELTDEELGITNKIRRQSRLRAVPEQLAITAGKVAKVGRKICPKRR